MTTNKENEEIMKEIKRNSEVINPTIWYVDPNDIRQALLSKDKQIQEAVEKERVRIIEGMLEEVGEEEDYGEFNPNSPRTLKNFEYDLRGLEITTRNKERRRLREYLSNQLQVIREHNN